MATIYYVASGYCAERVTAHETLTDAIAEADVRKGEKRCGMYVEPFIYTSEASEADGAWNGLTREERDRILEEL